ncbi:HTA1 [Cordylochernes scorpioides]|uniref:HTA1 n=1 Tax=Cordylochernes scorpioides TaxID=51811 RepID=A0ABY6LDF9_9ARAC|nr:HTA1 [Cordylochernes scorpioides]
MTFILWRSLDPLSGRKCLGWGWRTARVGLVLTHEQREWWHESDMGIFKTKILFFFLMPFSFVIYFSLYVSLTFPYQAWLFGVGLHPEAMKITSVAKATIYKYHLGLEGNYAEHFGASVYLTAILEYLAAEVLADNSARDNKHTRIMGATLPGVQKLHL